MSTSNGLYISGLISGLDTDSLIESIMYMERQPQTLVQDKSSLLTARQNVYSTLSAKLSALETVVAKFKSLGDPFFTQKTASSTNTSVATATITGANPAMGSVLLQVTQLASAATKTGLEALYTGSDRVPLPAEIVSTGLSVDPNQSLAAQAGNYFVPPDASGAILVNGQTINWDNSMSLNQIVGLINNAGAGVTAAYDSGSSTLSFTSLDTGAAAEITLGESSGNLLTALNLTAGTVTGSDAVAPDLGEPVGLAAANLDVAITSGTFTINGVTFYVDAATDSLQTILGRISSSGANVNAAFDENTGTVSLTQKSTGSSQSIVLGNPGDTSNLLYALKLSANNPPVGGAADTVVGTDALVSMNGGASQSYTSNTVTGLIPGVSLTLSGVGETSVTIKADTDAMVETIGEFVDEYNALMNYINTKTREERVEDPETVGEKLQGSFVGDTLFLSTKDQLGALVTSVVSGLPGTLNQLAQIGITTTADDFGKDATLELDEDKLRAALEGDVEGVEDLFNGVGGIMTSLEEKLDTLTDGVFGTFAVQDKALGEEISKLNEQIETMEERLLKREQTVRNQFTAMETALAELQAVGTQISALLGNSTSSS